MREASTSLGFVEVVWGSAGMTGGRQIDGGLCLTGREKLDGAGSKE